MSAVVQTGVSVDPTKTAKELVDVAGQALLDRVAEAVLSDLRETPTQFSGSPYKKTGELVRGLHFKKGTASARRAGNLGTIYAPMSRFASKWIKKGYRDRFGSLWDTRGIGWSRPDLRGA